MTQFLHFATDKGEIVIELLANEFVDFWLQHFLRLQTRYSLSLTSVGWPYSRKSDHYTDVCIKHVVDTFNKINHLPYVSKLPVDLDVTVLKLLNLETQQVLNQLHRCLVTATEYRDRWHRDQGPEFAWINYENSEFHYLTNLLNQQIHALEGYVNTPNKTKYQCWMRFREINFVASQYQDVNIYPDDVDLSVPDRMQKYLSLEGHSVWIKKDILGKDFITAFVDHDSAREFDVRPPPMISGGLIIDENRARKNFFKTQDFEQWLGEPAQNCHGSYPLGNIVQGQQILSQATSVKFDKIS